MGYPIKYKVGDTVWLINNNKPAQLKIDSIIVRRNAFVNTLIFEESDLRGNKYEANEGDAFATREDLIADIVSSIK